MLSITTPLRVGSAGQSGVGARLNEAGAGRCPRSGKSSCSGLESALIVDSLVTSRAVTLLGCLLETTERFQDPFRAA